MKSHSIYTVLGYQKWNVVKPTNLILFFLRFFPFFIHFLFFLTSRASVPHLFFSHLKSYEECKLFMNQMSNFVWRFLLLLLLSSSGTISVSSVIHSNLIESLKWHWFTCMHPKKKKLQQKINEIWDENEEENPAIKA